MTEANRPIDTLVAHLFRHEAARLLAVLTRYFGPANIALAEDIVQDTLLAALDDWSVNTIPDNPAAWLTRVAQRKAINEIQRRKRAGRHHEAMAYRAAGVPDKGGEIFSEKEIRDSQLRMIFTCCHPDLALEAQIALTLKTLCGFSVREVARALLSTESTINKRLYRARQRIRSGRIPFDVPGGTALDKRLRAVCLTLYLLFNEGYNSSQAESIIRKDLCAEAMRLTRLLTEFYPDKAELFALLALMCFHAARFDARVDKQGAIVIFEEQDRGQWKRELIAAGMRYLSRASGGATLSEYHLEAGIAAEHCLAAGFEDTDWHRIYRQYELLYRIKPNPIIKLNLAIITSRTAGPGAALRKLEGLAASGELKDYYLLPVSRGIFSMKVGRYAEARQFLIAAQALTESTQEREFLKKNIQTCENRL